MSENRLAAKLTKVDKAAILLLSLGETDAAQVLRHMGPKEVQRVGVAMASMRNVHREQVEQVMGEFVEVVGDQTSLGVGADGYIRKMLTQALGEDKANNLIDRILLGGSTSGRATTAPIGPFSQERVRASHQAMGVPISSRRRVVSEASSMVSQMAARSVLSSGNAMQVPP